MAVSANQLAEASHYNTVATTVNKVFGDNYSTAAVTDASRIDTHKFGWGATNVADALTAGTSITAVRLQDLVERANVSVDHINVTDSNLVFVVPTNRSNVTAATLVRAEDLNVVEDKFTNTIIANDAHATMDAANASALNATPTSGGPYTRSSTWNGQLVGEHKWTWGSYNKARYFFNAGGQVRLALAMSGGSTAGYYNWSDVINEMGVMNLLWNNFTQSNATTSGTSQAKGFYNLTQYYGDGSDAGATNEGLLFTSNGVTLSRTVGDSGTSGSAYGYITGPGTFAQWGDWAIIGGTQSNTIYVSAYSAYSTYQNLRFKIYGKYADGGASVMLKFILDDSAHANVIDGSITPTLSYLMPDNITQGGATFSVTPAPTVSITNNLTSPDDY
tara:strand:+ start:5476 stop:6642 length:1167 start_codon:yes stop_codon:yes gene_type:complete